jgi:hypothetical protein
MPARGKGACTNVGAGMPGPSPCGHTTRIRHTPSSHGQAWEPSPASAAGIHVASIVRGDDMPRPRRRVWWWSECMGRSRTARLPMNVTAAAGGCPWEHGSDSDVGVVRERPGGCPRPQLQPKSNRRNLPATTNIDPARWRQPRAAHNHRALPEAPLHGNTTPPPLRG